MRGSENGSVMVIVITGMTLLAAIGAGIASMVNSGARAGVDQSLSVQALYAAESGVEWSGLMLRDSDMSWVDFCKGSEEDGIGLKYETPPEIAQNEDGALPVFFTIVGSQLYPDEEDPQGCEVTVSGWVGIDEDNVLAKRIIKSRVPQSFLEASGGGSIPEGVDVYGGDGEELDGLNIGTHETAYVEEGTVINGNVSISNHSDVYFYNDVKVTGGITLSPNGYAYFGDNFFMDGNILIDGEACFGNNVLITGDLTLQTNLSNVCIKDNVEIRGTITVANNAQLCIGKNPDIDCGGISKKKNSVVCSEEASCDYGCDDGYVSTCKDVCDDLCEDPPELTGDGVSQNPVDTTDGAWSEG
jgi:hypothetical protein